MPTKIEWADERWNPWWGCNEIAPECGQYAPTGESGICYAAKFASRAMHKRFVGLAEGGKWTGVIARNSPAIWAAPFKWRRGLRVFTCSMSDFWHENVPLEWLDEALDIIERTPHIIYLILTKRPGNIARRLRALKRTMPANVWIGATIGHTHSLPILKPLVAVEATLRFLSCEPLLYDIAPHLNLDRIGWVIGGGQSGKGAAIGDAGSMRRLRDKCIAADVPFFLKQWGTPESNPTPADQELDPAAKGGATLDGRLWRQFPEAA